MRVQVSGAWQVFGVARPECSATDVDSEVEPADTLLFSITFVPFGKVTTPKKQ